MILKVMEDKRPSLLTRIFFLMIFLVSSASSINAQYKKFKLSRLSLDSLLVLNSSTESVDSLLEIKLLIHEKVGDSTEKGIYWIDDFVSFAREQGRMHAMYYGLIQSGIVDINNNQFVEAKAKLTSCIDYYSKRDTVQNARAHVFLGYLYYKIQEYDQAITYYSKADSMTWLPEHHILKHNIWNRMGMLSGAVDRIEDAEYYYYKIINDCRDNKLCSYYSNALNNLRQQYALRGMKEKELELLDETIKAYTKREDLSGKVFLYKNLARKERIRNNFREALPYQHLYLSQSQKISSAGNILIAMEQLSHVHWMLNQKDSSFHYASMMKEVAENHRSYKYMSHAYNKIANYYKDRKQFDLSTEYLQLASAAKDSIDNAKAKLDLIKFEQKQLLLEEERKNKELATQNALLASETKAKQQRIVYLSLILFLLLLSLYFIYRTLRNKQKQNALLDQQKKTIEKNLKEKELLLREIHHRVKNNLQMVSGLLNIQSEYIKDNAAIAAIQAGKDRVSSMALIHQNLYQGDILSGVHSQSYFERLIENLDQSFGFDSLNIEIENDIDDILLDVDTMVSLGLICNELLTNAIKYAYPKQEGGKINLELKQKNKTIHFQVSDNGIGIDTENLDNTESFGYRMIKAFSNKLDAELSINNHQGTSVSLHFLKNEAA